MILLTGASGFIGGAVARKLKTLGYHFVSVGTSTPKEEYTHYEIVRGGPIPLIDGVDSIIHCAANPNPKPDYDNPNEIFEDNLFLTNRLLSTYRNQIKNFTFLSSIKIYGDRVAKSFEEDIPRPDCLYGVSKVAAEELVRSYSRTFGFDHCILRLCPVVGKEQTHGIVKDFIERAKTVTDKFNIDGKFPGSIRPYVHIDDVVNAILLADEQSIQGTFNVSSDNEISNAKLANTILTELGKINVVDFPNNTEPWKGDSRSMRPSNKKLRSHGWDPKFRTAELAVRNALYF